MADEPRSAGSPRRCAVCGKLAAAAFRPFCSERCKQIDLGAWAEEKYTIPAVNLPLEDEGDKPVQ